MFELFWDNLLIFKKRYDQALDPVAQACGLTRMELDLLLFLHNNPTRNTAAEAVRLRRCTPWRKRGCCPPGTPPATGRCSASPPCPPRRTSSARGPGPRATSPPR